MEALGTFSGSRGFSDSVLAFYKTLVREPSTLNSNSRFSKGWARSGWEVDRVKLLQDQG